MTSNEKRKNHSKRNVFINTKSYNHKTWLPALMVLISSILFATKAIVIKHLFATQPQLNGVSVLALRMLTALPFYIFMVIVASYYVQHHIKPKAKDWALLLLAGFVGYYGASILDFIGLQYISASLERLILFLYPTFTVVLHALVYRHKISKITFISLVLSYLGIVLVVLGDLQNQLAHTPHFWWGVGLVVLSSLAYASYLLFAPPLIKTFGGWRFSGLAMTISCCAAITHYFVSQCHPLQTLLNYPHTVWMWGAFLGIFATVIPTTLLMLGMRKIGSANTALISAASPVLTIVLAVVVLREPFTGLQAVGCALNMLGVLLITAKPQPTVAKTVAK